MQRTDVETDGMGTGDVEDEAEPEGVMPMAALMTSSATNCPHGERVLVEGPMRLEENWFAPGVLANVISVFS